ncbi:unnamed protein product (macronuclear) [Paramecium tetraurelia]|uniref:Uncharacterized protein n=1 Tax=Paramecium tetraurelia TaxID=5888 RepID=A0BLL3_PARTE|nr:uncharacterized protein GSPATT00030063001 [Paramecium tetraurelia]CAK59430.1 unnamed protein product [Paramecium tetraurelia]|eukprot:XP_001426828.1 hypothetical protein (macronuclear) [Paramecium tetraurelia strain d4-2]
MSHSAKEYLPIVFADLQISTKNDYYIEEKLPILKSHHHTTSQPKLSKVTTPSKSQQEIINHQNAIKKIVFPNILQRTKQDIKKYRKHQLSLISDEISNSQPIIELEHKKISKTNSQSPLKLHSQQPSYISNYPIRTDLSSLIFDNNLESQSNDSIVKFRKLSPTFNETSWQKVDKVNRINLAHEVQKEIHHLERFNAYWKPDMINQYLQLKIVHQGVNQKRGNKRIFILMYLPHQTLVLKSSQVEVKNSPLSLQLNTLTYFVPLYEKISNQSELTENYNIWSKHFLDLLHYKQHINTVKFYFLDGKELQTLNQIPSYEKFIYCNLHGEFDLWNRVGQTLNLGGQFQLDKYVKLATKMVDLRSKDDILKFFGKRDNFLPFYSMAYNQEDECAKSPILQQIEMIQQDADDEQLNDEVIDQSIFQMNKNQQKAYLKTIKQFIQQNKTKYSQTLANQEAGMRQRKQNIKEIRRKSIEIKLKGQKQMLDLNEETHIEMKLLHEDTQSIDEIKEDAVDKVDVFKNAIYKKLPKKIELTNDPFSSFSSKDNKKFKEIMKLINIEQIVLEKKLNRQDVMHYLSLFKALMDSDNLNYFTTSQLDYPSLYISREQLKKSLPYIILYKNQLNTGKLNEIYERQYNYVEFLDFLDIFTTEYIVSEKELERLKNQKQDAY